jgi:hypothetical protein
MIPYYPPPINDRLSIDHVPPLPYHPDGFVGRLEADGQQVKVAALACDGEVVVLLSLVGYDTSIGVMLGRLWGGTKVEFLPASSWADEWHGPVFLRRAAGSYRTTGGLLAAHLREVHALALLRAASIREGILNPPALPKPEEEGKKGKESESRDDEADSEQNVPASSSSSSSSQPSWVPRYILANWGEASPNRRAFQGHLAALRIPILYRHDRHPDWPEQWADALWQRGLAASLITPIEALGVRAWRISGDLLAWGKLVGAGVRSGWLPWRD